MANTSLVLRIIMGIVLGAGLAVVAPGVALSFSILGLLFVGALKAIAPILVFVLVTASIANQKKGQHTNMKPIISLYLIGTMAASLIAVIMSFAFPVTLTLAINEADANPPQGIGEVLNTLLFNMVQNPIEALVTGNFIGVLAWAIALGLVLHRASDATKHVIQDISEAVSHVVRFVIQLAPFGIFGLVANTVARTGFSALAEYGHLLIVLVSSMLMIALVVNPLIVFAKIRRNPYPLVFQCLRGSVALLPTFRSIWSCAKS